MKSFNFVVLKTEKRRKFVNMLKNFQKYCETIKFERSNFRGLRKKLK